MGALFSSTASGMPGMPSMSEGQLTNMVNTNSSVSTNPLTSLALNFSVSQLNNLGQSINHSLSEIGNWLGENKTSGSSGNNSNNYTALTRLQVSYIQLLAQVNQYKSVAPSLKLSALNIKINDLRAETTKLDNEKAAIFEGPSFTRTGAQAVHYWTTKCLYYFGPIFAVIIILNTFYYSTSSRISGDVFWFFKLFYTFWAVLLYPLAILYGIIAPPEFLNLFPLFGPESKLNTLPLFGYGKPSDNIIIREKYKLVFRLISITLFSIFVYTFIFSSGLSSISTSALPMPQTGSGSSGSY
jgi:hypothetical protein